MWLLLFAFVINTHAASRDVWPASAYTSARALVAQLTLDEKVQLASGNNAPYSACHFSRKECSYVGAIAGIPRLGVSSVKIVLSTQMYLAITRDRKTTFHTRPTDETLKNNFIFLFRQ